jgi:hypothetical protein
VDKTAPLSLNKEGSLDIVHWNLGRDIFLVYSIGKTPAAHWCPVSFTIYIDNALLFCKAILFFN